MSAVLPATRQRAWARGAAAVLMLGLFYTLPWLSWNGQPLFLLDIGTRQFHVFGLSVQPEQSLFLLWSGLGLAAVLCLVTVLYGRLWCGYACPQSVLSRLFRSLDRITRFHGALQPLRAPLRHGLWGAIALWTGISFVGYFTPITGLVANLAGFSLGGWESFWIGFYGLATWANVLFLHEQVCTTLCPYARVQGFLTDACTPSIQYNAPRGEPRGVRPEVIPSVLERPRGLLDPDTARDYVFRAAHPAIAGALPNFSAMHLGDCVDCNACVSACPIGLDIRNGPAGDCIECSACIDACDDTMQRLRFPAGLIRRTRTATEASGDRSSLRIKPLLFASLAAAFLVLALVSAHALG